MKFSALVRKEFFRFFHDPKLLIALLLPGILIYIVYSILGVIVNDEEATYEYRVYLLGSSQTVAVVEQAVSATGSTVEWLEAEAEEAKAAVEKGEATAYLEYSEGFDEAIMPAVTIGYRAGDEESARFYTVASGALTAAGMRYAVLFENFTAQKDMVMQAFGAFLPMLIVVFIFTSCMSVTLVSVAGEKERGTLSTILVTSAPRTQIALGKIVPLSCIASLGALSSFLGIALSMPKLMGLSLSTFGGYGFMSYFLLFLLILGIVPLIVGVIAAVSTYAKTEKEASAYTSVVMILSMVITIAFGMISHIGDWIVVLPVFNAAYFMQTILMGGLPIWQTFVSFGLNLAYTAALTCGIAAMLSNERIMFGR